MTYLEFVIYYLELCIIRNLEVGIISLTQETYISRILERFRIKDTKKVDTSMIKKDILIHSNPSYYADPSTVI